MMLYVLAALIIVLAWAATYLLQLPLWMGLAATGPALLVMGAAFIRRRRARAKQKQDTAGEKAPAAPPQEPAKPSRPEVLPEIQAMQAEFSRAVTALKSSKLSRGGRDALAVLPWYLLIGPPSAGKSTALRNSGLKFPYVSQRGGGGRGVGETHACDWWLTNEAVFLDTAGRYTSSADSREEWFAFLDTLIKYRPHRPINGLVVTVSVTDLMGEDPQAAGDLGQRIRERIDEMTARLRVVVPIYVLLTKCDLLPGFVEMFSDLPRSERGQIWGFTVPLAAQSEAPSELLLKRFDEMTAVLEQRSIRRLGQERRLEARERIYQFPQRFDALRKNLSEFVQPLFMENVFQDTPVMRGLYFTSGTQEARLGERPANAGSSETLLGPLRPANTEPSTEGRSFFIWDVFNKVMFQDQKLAIRSSMEEIRQRKRRYAMAGACLAMAMAMLVLPTLSFLRNRDMVRQVRDTIVGVKLQATDDIERVEELSPLQQHLAELHQHRVDGPPFWMRMGMYKGAELFPLAQDFYNAQLKELLLGRQHKRIKQNLLLLSQNQDAPDWKPSNESFGHHFDDLKMYLLITFPRSLREPELDATHQDWLVKKMVAHWRDIRGPNGEMRVEQTIERHARTYIAMMADNPEYLAFEREDRVVKSARRTLNRVPLAVLEFDRIVDQANREFPALTLSDIAGTVPAVRATRKVSGAFTRVAWEDWIRSRMDSAFEDSEAWVLDRDAREDERLHRAELRTLYYQKYVQEWLDFLWSIRVDEPKDLDQTEALLVSLTNRKPSPFGRLFQSLAHNVHLEEPRMAPSKLPFLLSHLPSLEAQAPTIRKVIAPKSSTGEYEMMPLDVEKSFASIIGFANKKYATDDKEEQLTQLAFYEDQLRNVLKTLLDVREKPGEAGLLIEKIASSRNEVALLIKSQEGHHGLFEQLLLPPLAKVKVLVFRDVSEKKSLQWCEDVAIPFGSMARRYPFTKNSMMDAPLREFAQFLHPSDGVVRNFVKTRLSEEVLLDSGKWTFAHPSLKDMYKADLLTYLNRVDDLRDTLFPGGDDKRVDPLVRFAVRIRPAASADSSPSDIASISLTVDGTEELYRNGPDDRWRKLEWPGPAGELGAHLQVISTQDKKGSVHGEGEWGLFRLLERAKTIEPSQDGRSFTATWEIAELNNALVSIDFRPERTYNPFFGTPGGTSTRLLEIFRDPRLIPPAGIAQIARSCATSP